MSFARRGRAIAKRLSDEVVRTAFAHRGPRRVMNAVYRALPAPAHRFVYTHFAKIFRSTERCVAEGVWVVDFGGNPIRLPVKRERAWLDWDEAVSILGHEYWIKDTYSTLLTSAAPPPLFVDIGANYGTHSLLFLSHGVEVISFEPNASCHAYFREACLLNGFRGQLQPVALGARRGAIELCYPERDTWLGRTGNVGREATSDPPGLIRQRVEMLPLDEFAATFSGRRSLIKIDAEGYELEILAGAEEILRQHRPVIVFEAPQESGVSPVVAYLRAREYEIAALPVLSGRPVRVLGDETANDYGDLLAVPKEFCAPGVLADGANLFAR